MIPPSTPILETLQALKLAFDVPSHVRTAGDLIVALERGEIEVDEKNIKRFALLNYMESPEFLESLERNFKALRVLSKPGVTLTKEQKSQIETMQDAGDVDAARRTILDKLNT